MMDIANLELGQTPPPVIRQVAELSVLTYNIRGLPWPIARSRGDALRQIGRELAALRDQGAHPDVVLIQEGFRSEVADLYRMSGYRYWAKGPEPTLGRVLGGGLHIFADSPIVDVRRLSYAACAGYDCLANKGAMLVRLEPEGAPGPVEVLNTHMNSRRASGAPPAAALAAHNRQTEQLFAFIARKRDPSLPLLVGGDFNVKNDARRYEHRAEARPYKVVSEFCAVAASCEAPGEDAASKPWLKSQDLQAFADDHQVRIHPVATAALFDGERKLSDHDGYLVRYRLAWTPPAPQRQALEIRANPAKLRVKVSWTPGAP